jgi:hypothetical protein
MKYLNNTLLLLIGSIFICSCSDEDFIEPMPIVDTFEKVETGVIQASLDGVLFSCDNIHTSNDPNSLLKITAFGSNYGFTLGLSSATKGIYNIGGLDENYLTYTTAVYQEGGSVETQYTSLEKHSATGSIEILETDLENNTISGTFSGVIILDDETNQSIEITEGVFNQVPF